MKPYKNIRATWADDVLQFFFFLIVTVLLVVNLFKIYESNSLEAVYVVRIVASLVGMTINFRYFWNGRHARIIRYNENTTKDPH